MKRLIIVEETRGDDCLEVREHELIKPTLNTSLVVNGATMITTRNQGNLKDKGWYLNDNYRWEIVEDEYGIPVLVALRKEGGGMLI